MRSWSGQAWYSQYSVVPRRACRERKRPVPLPHLVLHGQPGLPAQRLHHGVQRRARLFGILLAGIVRGLRLGGERPGQHQYCQRHRQNSAHRSSPLHVGRVPAAKASALRLTLPQGAGGRQAQAKDRKTAQTGRPFLSRRRGLRRRVGRRRGARICGSRGGRCRRPGSAPGLYKDR